MSFAASLNAGHAALARAHWPEAFRRFDEVLTASPSDPEAHEGRALAGWWMDMADVVFASREVAYRGYRERGDALSAARIAVWLAWDHDAFRGEFVVASGWLGRARELLADHTDTAEYAWLSVREAAFALLDHSNPADALRFAEEAITAGRASQSVDFEMVGRSLRGFALATSGQVGEGMRELDGVAAAVLGGELRNPLAIGLACCYLIAACDRVRDYDRAVQWCARLKVYCEQWQFRTLFAVCRTQYAAVCMWRGAWSEAESELEAATDELTASRPGMVSEALVRLGELRRRQGRLDEGYALFERAGHHPLGVVGRAMVAADRGDWEGAAELAERHLRQLPEHNRTERAAALELLVRAAVARGLPHGTDLPLRDLQAIASQAGTRPLRAMAQAAAGVAAAGQGDLDGARRAFEDAVDLFRQSGAHFELARACLDLADTLLRLKRPDVAERELVAAEKLLVPMEATAELQRAASLRAQIAAMQGGNAAMTDAVANRKRQPAGLTGREIDVLRLIATGLGNPAIATQLGISEHTVHRHVANTLTKLGSSSRAAAVAQAARLGLL